MIDDPYHDNKPVHKAALISHNGRHVSPLCADRPKPINLKRATWTLLWDQVTCPKCLARREA